MENPLEGKSIEAVTEYILASALEANAKSNLAPDSMPFSTQAAAFEAAVLALTEKCSPKQQKAWADSIPKFQKLATLAMQRIEQASMKLNQLRASLEEDEKRSQ